MKLLYVLHTKLPTEKAHGLQTVKTCEALASLGLDVTLMASKRGRDAKDIFEFYGTKRNFVYKPVASFHILRLGPLGFFLQSLTLALYVFLYIQKNKTEIVYSRNETVLYFVSFFHSRIFWETHDAKDSFFAKRVLTKSQGVIAITEGLKKFYIEKDRMLEAKITVVPDAVDISKFSLSQSQEECREIVGLPKDRKIALYSGHLYAWKGAHILAEVSKKMEGVLFVFVGGTEYDLIHFRKMYSSLKNVLILGKRPHSDIPYYLKSADVLILPNSGKEDISRLYTSPMKLFEYMASGTPIVSSDLPSLREVLDEKSAVLVAPDDPSELQKGIMKIVSDPIFGLKLAEEAKKKVLFFDWKRRGELIKEQLV